jgi:hypothetical protein
MFECAADRLESRDNIKGRSAVHTAVPESCVYELDVLPMIRTCIQVEGMKLGGESSSSSLTLESVDLWRGVNMANRA